MNGFPNTHHFKLSPKRKAIISLALGIFSLIPEIIYIGIWSWYINMETLFQYLEKYFFVFFPLAIICGIAGLIMGTKSFKLHKIAILGMILSLLGIIGASFILAFGLYTASF